MSLKGAITRAKISCDTSKEINASEEATRGGELVHCVIMLREVTVLSLPNKRCRKRSKACSRRASIAVGLKCIGTDGQLQGM